MDSSKEGVSEKLDLYMWMEQKNNIQNIFHFSTTSKGFTCSSPGLVMRCPHDWNKGPMIYTDWYDPMTKGKKPNMIYWKKKKFDEPFTPTTSLVVTEELKRLYITPREQRNRKEPDYYHDDTYRYGKEKDDVNQSVEIDLMNDSEDDKSF